MCHLTKRHFHCPACRTHVGDFLARKFCPKKCVNRLHYFLSESHERVDSPHLCMKCADKAKPDKEFSTGTTAQVAETPFKPLPLFKSLDSASSCPSREQTVHSKTEDSNTESSDIETHPSTLSESESDVPASSDTLSEVSTAESHIPTLAELVRDSDPDVPVKHDGPWEVITKSEGYPSSWPLKLYVPKKPEDYFSQLTATELPATAVQQASRKYNYFSSRALESVDFAPSEGMRELATACARKAESVHQLGQELEKKRDDLERVLYGRLRTEMSEIEEQLKCLEAIHSKIMSKSWGVELERDLVKHAKLEQALKDSRENPEHDAGVAHDFKYQHSKNIGSKDGTSIPIPEPFWDEIDEYATGNSSVDWVEDCHTLTFSTRQHFN